MSKNILSYEIDWRIKNVHNKNSKDKYIKLYRKFKDKHKPEYIADSVFIYQNPISKMLMESMSLSGMSDEEVADYFGCELDAIEFYKKMFFDIDEVRASKMKLLLIANSGLPNEIQLKSTAVKFGKEFMKWYLGLTDKFNDEFDQKLLDRLDSGVKIKSLGHEFVDSGSDRMNNYLKLIGIIDKKEAMKAEVKRQNSGKEYSDIVSHLNKCFNAEEHE